MAWLISANIIVTVFLVGLSQSEIVFKIDPVSNTGTCASIGYSTKCCPLGENCTITAEDGNCKCDATCHNRNDYTCCKDVFCRPGITKINEVVLFVRMHGNRSYL